MLIPVFTHKHSPRLFENVSVSMTTGMERNERGEPYAYLIYESWCAECGARFRATERLGLFASLAYTQGVEDGWKQAQEKANEGMLRMQKKEEGN